MIEALTACACALPCLLVPALGFAVWAGVRSGQQVRAQASTASNGLLRLGLVPGGEGWHVGEIGGRAVAVKVSSTARVDGAGGVGLGLLLSARFALDVQVPAHVFPNMPRRGHTLDRLFYVGAGKPPQGLPPALADGLVRWALEVPADRVEVGPRTGRDPHPGARSIVSVDRSSLGDTEGIRAWLEACASRVSGLTPR